MLALFRKKAPPKKHDGKRKLSSMYAKKDQLIFVTACVIHRCHYLVVPVKKDKFEFFTLRFANVYKYRVGRK